MILTNDVEIRIANKSQYEHYKKEYDIEYGDIITIPVNKLTKGSSIKIDVKCDICDNEKIISYSKYIKNISKYDIYSCSEKCANFKNKKTLLIRYGKDNPNLKDIDIKKWENIQKEKELIRKEKTEKLIKDGGKVCIKCDTFRVIDDYCKRNSYDGRVNTCKFCINERRNDRYHDNKVEMLPIIRERKNKYRKNNKIIFIWRQTLHSCLRRMDQTKTDMTIKMLGYSATELKINIENQFTTDMTWDNYGEWHIDHIRSVATFDKKTPASVVNALSNLQPMWATTREIDGVLYEGNLNKGKRID